MTVSEIERLCAHLTNEQQAVVEHVSGPLAVKAGPGSGKTQTVILRAINLLASEHVRPENLVITTFSRDAALDLEKRFIDAARAVRPHADWSQVQINTIHGFCQNLLRAYGQHIISPRFSVLDDLGRSAFLDSHLTNITTKRQREILSSRWRSTPHTTNGLLQAFDHMVDQCLNPTDMVGSRDPFRSVLASVYLEYEAVLKAAHFADFCHLLRWAHDLLSDPDSDEIINEHSQVMVDEYQDTSPLQEKIFRRWTTRSGNLVVFGDDNQSIYSFRGALPGNMASFATTVPDCRTLRLSENFRSDKGIAETASEWIEKTTGDSVGRCAAALRSPGEHVEPEYPSVLAVDGRTPEDEADQLARLFVRLKADGVIEDYDQVALLLHTAKGDICRPYTEAFQRHGVPHVVGRQGGLFDRPEIRLMIGCLAIVFGDFSHRGDGSRAVDGSFHRCLQDAAERVRAGIDDRSVLGRALLRWPQQIREAAQRGYTLARNLHDYCYSLLSVEPFSTMLDDPKTAASLALWSRCVEAFHVHYGHRQICGERVQALRYDFFERFLPLLYQNGGWHRVAETERTAGGHAQILTVHQSKGREFPVVAVGSLNHDPVTRKSGSDVFDSPSAQSWRAGAGPDAMEPARCKYVAFTRAERLLVLCGNRNPSPTLEQLWKSLPRWSANTHRTLAQQRFPRKASPPPPPVYSVTADLAKYGSCPRRYQYFRKHRFVEPVISHGLVGDIVHGSIDVVNRAVLRGVSPDQIPLRQTVTEQSRTALSLLGPAESRNAVEAAYRQVSRYVGANAGVFPSIVASEVDLRTDEGAFVLRGRTDLLTENDGALEVTDFKTGNRSTWTAQRRTEYERQLMLYAHMAEQQFGRPVSRTHIYWTAETNPAEAIESFIPTPERILGATQWAAGVTQAITAEDFTVRTRPPIKVCNSCALRTVCQRDGTINRN
ncbi:MAG: ATP-dependent DNA helicase [Chloroflexi bacterium]|nr:ATP-dependent DNA helicase [Chloroflexota bacterium]